MTATVPATLEARPRSATALWMAAVVALAVVGSVVAVLLLRYPSDEAQPPEGSATARQQLAAFRDALAPLVERGGHVVAAGIKPGIADIRDERYPAEVLTTMANGWIAELESVHRDLEATKHPAFLDDAHGLYLRSLEGYVNTATALRAAAVADEAHEQELLDLAASLGRSADSLFDQADELVGREQARLDRPVKEK